MTRLFYLLSLAVSAWTAIATTSSSAVREPKWEKKPNIIFVLTDDQDVKMNSMDYMPFVKKHLTEQGTSYPNHYCTVSLCCPARAILWTGMNAHNTNVTDLAPPWGGYPKFVDQGLNDDYLPLWLKDGGYQTYYAGKLFNTFNTTNYNDPCPRGWTDSEFLIDPHTYSYYHPGTSRDCGPVVVHNGSYGTDLLFNRAFGFIDDALDAKSPFFLAIAPVAPHNAIDDGVTSAPQPASKYADWFLDAKVPRTYNFNPDKPSGASWIKTLGKLNDTQLEDNDEWYRQRLRSLQSVDEMVDKLFQKLESENLLDNTYVIYSSDNGFHISQHRMIKGKQCGYEEDINVPLIIRGPQIRKNVTSSAVTAHTDLSPTFMHMAGLDQRETFDGSPIPLWKDHEPEPDSKTEHANVEYWALKAPEFEDLGPVNATYKSARLVAEDYSFYYSVWCSNEHELYDMKADPGQMDNFLEGGFDTKSKTKSTDLGVTDYTLATRLDSLLFVLKSCKGKECRQPWETLLPGKGVQTLKDALSPKYDSFFEDEVPRVSFTSCEAGYIISAEGPQLPHWLNEGGPNMRSIARAAPGEDPAWAMWT